MKNLEHNINRIVWLAQALQLKPWKGGTWDRQRWINRRSTLNLIRVAKSIGLTPKLLVDVGANNSQWSYWLLQEWPDIRIVSFEPNPNCHPMGEVHRVALSNHSGESRMSLENDGGISSHLSSNGAIPVKVCRLDEFPLTVDGPAILKIDCENATANALEGAGSKLKDFRLIAVELLGDDHEEADHRGQWHRIHEVMRHHGFDCATALDVGFWSGRPIYMDVVFWKPNAS